MTAADDDRRIEPVDGPIDIDLRGTTLRATDIAGNVVACDLTGWNPVSWSHTIEEPIDAAVTGRVSELRYDLRNAITLERLDDALALAGQERPVADGLINVAFDDDVTYQIPPGEYFCQCDCEVFTRIRFDSEATVRNRSHGAFSITFPHPTPMTIAFKSAVEVPQERLVVEPTAAGLATAITNMASALRTTGTAHVHRSYRAYPPLIEIGSETDIPDSVRDGCPETGIELIVPETLSALYTAAPVAYFLGARLVPSADDPPHLRADAFDVSYEIPTEPTFSDGITDVLRRTFFLEMMVDWIEPDAPTVDEYAQLRSAGFDLESCLDRPLAERVATYLDLPADPVDDVLPGWPSRTTIEAAPSYAPAIPHLLHDLSAIDTPETTGASAASIDVTSEQSRSPREKLLDAQELHGTIGTIEQTGDFDARLAAYENRLRPLERGSETTSVLVATGPSIDPERADRIAAAYTDREETVATIVETLSNPTRAALVRALSDGVDFFQYAGSCSDGLACRDGRVDPETMGEVDTSIIQLDGADSQTLVDAFVSAGAVAVVCRDRPPSGRPETIVGTLLLYGQSVATAARCSQLIAPDSTLTVVGDGTHRFVAKWKPTSIQAVSEAADGSVTVSIVPFSVDPVGAHWRPGYDSRMHLMPSSFSYSIGASSFNEYILHNNQPILTEDRLYLPDEQRQLLYPIA